jgi:hypothetical protein
MKETAKQLGEQSKMAGKSIDSEVKWDEVLAYSRYDRRRDKLRNYYKIAGRSLDATKMAGEEEYDGLRVQLRGMDYGPGDGPVPGTKGATARVGKAP